MYVGRQVDPYYYSEIFKVQDFQHIDKAISEDEMFAEVETSAYLAALNSIIN